MSYLEKSWRFGSRLGLERIRELMRRLGDPQKQLRYIHVAGTNGKGSTVNFIATILAEAGSKVGIYTSPYINRFGERIRVLDGPAAVSARVEDESAGEITETEVGRYFSEVAAAADQMAEAGLDAPTEFELITAMGFLYFADQACDVVVLEVGLGGRLDSTNVIDAAEVCVITALGYDHMDRLGDTLSEIAAEKAGIIKPGTRAVLLYDPDDGVQTAEEAATIRWVLQERCRACAVGLNEVRRDEIMTMHLGYGGQIFRLNGYATPLEIRLSAIYQSLNAALAVRAVEAYMPELSGSYVVVSALTKAIWPARMEILGRDPLVVVDGAHNPQAAWKLRESMDVLAKDKAVIMLTGILEEKDSSLMLRELLYEPKYQVKAIVVTEPTIFRKKQAAVYLAGIEAFYRENPSLALPELYLEADATAALEEGIRLAAERDAVLLAWGSLYLASDLRGAYAKITEIRRFEKGAGNE